MKLLFVHQNFPGQYRSLAPILAQDPENQVVAIGDLANIGSGPWPPGLQVVGYETPQPSSNDTHHYIRNLEAAVRRGQQVVRLCIALRERGFVPDVICAHPGWGDALYIKDVFPESKLLSLFEFYYHGKGVDVGFDPEYPASLDDSFRVRTKNSINLFSLVGCDWGLTPTRWQWSVHPPEIRPKVSVIFDGVDTDLLQPNPRVSANVGDGRVALTKADEVITFVNRNLEPYRGWHSFIRAVPEIQRRRPNAQIFIVGGEGVSYGAQPTDKTYKEHYLGEVAGQVDMSRLFFLGRIPYDKFLALMQLSAVHVYLTYPFVLSWSMIEAMSVGAVVVGSRTPPVEEVIQHEKNGLLVDFFSPQQIAEAVDRVLDHPDRMQGLRRAARQTVIDRYDLRGVCLPRHVELIRNLAAGKLPRPSDGDAPVFE